MGNETSHNDIMMAIGELKGTVLSFKDGMDEAKEERTLMHESLAAIRDSLTTQREQHLQMDARLISVEKAAQVHEKAVARQQNWMVGFGAAVTLIFTIVWTVAGTSIKAALGLK